MLERTVLGVCLAAIAGCSPVDPILGGSIQGSLCQVIERRALAPDETTPLGSPSQLVSEAVGAQRIPLRWFEHGSTPRSGDTDLTAEATANPASAEYVTRRGSKPSDECPDRLERPATLAFQTADGSFNETFPGILYKQGSFGEVSFEGALPATDLEGSYDASVLRLDADSRYVIRTQLRPVLRGNVSLEDGAPPADPNATATTPAIADWPSAAAAVNAF